MNVAASKRASSPNCLKSRKAMSTSSCSAKSHRSQSGVASSKGCEASLNFGASRFRAASSRPSISASAAAVRLPAAAFASPQPRPSSCCAASSARRAAWAAKLLSRTGSAQSFKLAPHSFSSSSHPTSHASNAIILASLSSAMASCNCSAAPRTASRPLLRRSSSCCTWTRASAVNASSSSTALASKSGLKYSRKRFRNLAVVAPSRPRGRNCKAAREPPAKAVLSRSKNRLTNKSTAARIGNSQPTLLEKTLLAPACRLATAMAAPQTRSRLTPGCQTVDAP
mmetsp:Transcript_144464/g.462929  ORF Transcript_144464/g.462929 Transcript_144464/m.462929 type:complete len:283 (-) Transcript_144464:59-907(-)